MIGYIVSAIILVGLVVALVTYRKGKWTFRPW